MDQSQILIKYKNLSKHELGLELIKQSSLGNLLEIQNIIDNIFLLVDQNRNFEYYLIGPHVRDEKGMTPFLSAVMNAQIPVIEYWIKNKSIGLPLTLEYGSVEKYSIEHAADNNGFTALMIATKAGSRDIVNLWLQHLIQKDYHAETIGAKDNLFHYTALTYAFIYHHYDIALDLLCAMSSKQIDKEIKETPYFASKIKEFREVILDNRNKLFLMFGELIIKGQQPQLIASELSQHFPIWYVEKIENEFQWIKNILAQYKNLGPWQQNELLLQAVKNESLIELRLLFEARGGEEIKNLALKEAVRHGHISVVEFVLQNGANINVQSILGYTPLMSAIIYGHTALAECLINMGADLHIIIDMPFRNTAFTYAVTRGDLTIAFQLLYAMTDAQINRESLMNHQTIVAFDEFLLKNRTLLFSLLDDLIIKGRQPNLIDLQLLSQHFPTWYIRQINTEIQLIHDMLSEYKSLSQTDKNQMIIDEAEKGNFFEIQLLVGAGADINAVNPLQCTPLMFAAKKGSIASVELLLLKGADINAINADNETALIVAIYFSQFSIANFLITQGADIHLRDINGFSAFLYAAEKSHYNLAFRILHMMSSKQIETEVNQTPETLATHVQSIMNTFNNAMSVNRNKLFSIFGIFKDQELKVMQSLLSESFPKWFIYRLENELNMCATFLKEMKEKSIFDQLLFANDDQKSELIKNLGTAYYYKNCVKYLGSNYADNAFPEKQLFDKLCLAKTAGIKEDMLIIIQKLDDRFNYENCVEYLGVEQAHSLFPQRKLFDQLRLAHSEYKKLCIIKELGKEYTYESCVKHAGKDYAAKLFPQNVPVLTQATVDLILVANFTPVIFSQSEDIDMTTVKKKRKRSEQDDGSDFAEVEAKRIRLDEGNGLFSCLSSVLTQACSYLPSLFSQTTDIEMNSAEEFSDDEKMDIDNTSPPTKRCNRG